MVEVAAPVVARCGDLAPGALAALLLRCDLELRAVGEGEAIPWSYWGQPEAGLRGREVYVRADTPVHSALHESCHGLCMDEARRQRLVTDAGGDDLEEAAVCYLQFLLAAELPGYGRARLASDMDLWGYSFRLGSALAWFERDAEDARAWLVRHGIQPAMLSRRS